MMISDPEKNFEFLWKTFHKQIPIFRLEECRLEKAIRRLQTQSHK